jgi:hypothetical protein
VREVRSHRDARYAVRRLIERHGGGTKISDWKAEVTHDCSRRKSPSLADACAARCPDLLKIVAPKLCT